MTGPDLRRNAVNAQDLLYHLSNRKPFAIIFLLDCCRTYPLRNPDPDGRSSKASHSAPNGLKPMHEAGSLIAFACAPGTIAKDGRGQRNGLFTKYLLRYLPTANEDIQMVLRDVTNGVMEESNSLQVPYSNASLRYKPIYLCDRSPGNDSILVYYMIKIAEVV